MSMKNRRAGLLAGFGLLITAAAWGFGFVVVKNSLDYIPPTYMLAFRFSIAAIGLLLVFCRRLKNITKKMLKHSALLGFLLFSAYLIQTIGCNYTTAGKNAFLTTVYVILVPFLHWMINKRRPDRYCVIAAFAAIAGIGFLTLEGDLSVNIGDMLTLICGVVYALHIIFIDRYTEYEDPVLLAVLQICYAAVFSWICAPIFDGGFPEQAFNQSIIIGMLYLGLFSTMMAFLLQNVCQKYLRPATASLLMSTESVFGVAGSVLVLGEVLDTKMAIGCLLILGAIVLNETKPGSKRRAAKTSSKKRAAKTGSKDTSSKDEQAMTSSKDK